jgi:hypothetical protein
MNDALEIVGLVSGEGGPLLLGERCIVLLWEGSDHSGQDYDRACAIAAARHDVPGWPIGIGDGVGILWDMGGGGTAAVFQAPDRVIIARTWPVDPDADSAFDELARLPVVATERFASVSLPSGELVIIWSPENGGAFTKIDERGYPLGDMSMGGTGLCLRVQPGTYDLLHDAVSGRTGEAWRCHFVHRGR